MGPRPNLKLGDRAKDGITGYRGKVVAITNWLNGCQRITIQAEALHDGKPVDSWTFDAEQVEIIDEIPAPVTAPSGGPSIAPTRNRDPK